MGVLLLYLIYHTRSVKTISRIPYASSNCCAVLCKNPQRHRLAGEAVALPGAGERTERRCVRAAAHFGRDERGDHGDYSGGGEEDGPGCCTGWNGNWALNS